MYSFDASAIVDLWDNYPIQNPHFKSVWDWFDIQVKQENFVISKTALKEVKARVIFDKITEKIPESSFFIEILDSIKVYDKAIDDLDAVQKIKALLVIQEDDYGTGVGENDLFIIANAKRNEHILVSNEKRQPNPKNITNKANYKIPAVCSLDEVNVENINLTELLYLDALW